jgi:hypothetical protein
MEEDMTPACSRGHTTTEDDCGMQLVEEVGLKFGWIWEPSGTMGPIKICGLGDVSHLARGMMWHAESDGCTGLAFIDPEIADTGG